MFKKKGKIIICINTKWKIKSELCKWNILQLGQKAYFIDQKGGGLIGDAHQVYVALG